VPETTGARPADGRGFVPPDREIHFLKPAMAGWDPEQADLIGRGGKLGFRHCQRAKRDLGSRLSRKVRKFGLRGARNYSGRSNWDPAGRKTSVSGRARPLVGAGRGPVLHGKWKSRGPVRGGFGGTTRGRMGCGSAPSTRIKQMKSYIGRVLSMARIGLDGVARIGVFGAGGSRP
jgi:hypothetical protein